MESLHQYVSQKLQAHKGQWPSVAAGSGVSVKTFSKIAQGSTKDPRSSTLEKLARYFREQEVVN